MRAEVRENEFLKLFVAVHVYFLGSSVAPEHQARVRRRRRIPSGFTYISGCVKYTMFFFNFIFWLMGLLLMGVRRGI